VFDYYAPGMSFKSKEDPFKVFGKFPENRACNDDESIVFYNATPLYKSENTHFFDQKQAFLKKSLKAFFAFHRGILRIPYFCIMEELEIITDSTPQSEVDSVQAEIMEQYKRLAKLRRALPPELVADYDFTDWSNSKVRLSELFADKDELILIHNMGKSCAYCTLWADGFTGITKHLEDRAAFVLTSPDAPDVQQRFARDRGWTFRMVSTKGTTFKHDMGFQPKPNEVWPGVSVFRKDADGQIFHVSKSFLGPGDPYCAVWHFLDLLPSEREWEPKFHYV